MGPPGARSLVSLASRPSSSRFGLTSDTSLFCDPPSFPQPQFTLPGKRLKLLSTLVLPTLASTERLNSHYPCCFLNSPG